MNVSESQKKLLESQTSRSSQLWMLGAMMRSENTEEEVNDESKEENV